MPLLKSSRNSLCDGSNHQMYQKWAKIAHESIFERENNGSKQAANGGRNAPQFHLDTYTKMEERNRRDDQNCCRFFRRSCSCPRRALPTLFRWHQWRSSYADDTSGLFRSNKDYWMVKLGWPLPSTAKGSDRTKAMIHAAQLTTELFANCRLQQTAAMLSEEWTTLHHH